MLWFRSCVRLAPRRLSCACALRPAVFATNLFRVTGFVFTADRGHGQLAEDPYTVVELLLLMRTAQRIVLFASRPYFFTGVTTKLAADDSNFMFGSF